MSKSIPQDAGRAQAQTGAASLLFNRPLRNIAIMAAFAVGGGWLGIWLNAVTSNTQPPLQSLGALVWLASPALAGLLLRAFGGDGWSDAGFRPRLPSGWAWYVVAIAAFPLASLPVLALGVASGAVDLGGFAGRGAGDYIAAAALLFAGMLMKNLFEEFAWRGYLTARLQAAGARPWVNHAVVAVVWWAWHLPYYYYFLDRSDLAKATPYGLPVFLALGLLDLFPTALLFDELRLVSGSVWPVFLLHGLVNALSMPLLLNGFIHLNGPLGLLLSPTNDGPFTALLLGVIGWLLLRRRARAVPA